MNIGNNGPDPIEVLLQHSIIEGTPKQAAQYSIALQREIDAGSFWVGYMSAVLTMQGVSPTGMFELEKAAFQSMFDRINDSD